MACCLRALSLPLALALALAALTPLARAQSTVCFEKISNIAGLYFQEHPVRNRAVIAEQTGKMTLVTLPPVGSRSAAKPISTFLDLSGRVKNGDETGLLSFAFHPQFASNGRLFVSYICDSNDHPDCKAPCGCNPAVGCQVGQNNAGCNVVTVIAEYSAGRNPLQATSVIPREVRRVLSFARPYTNHMGGHIFFGKDGLLYYTSGDGGSQGDPWNLSQNPRSMFGKMMRMNVNKLPRGRNYTVPWNNPFRGKGNPLVLALGFRNPWRCDQDPWYGTIVCGDVGASAFEEVDVVAPGRNYEWHNWEGRAHRAGTDNKKALVGRAQDPLFVYAHSDVAAGGCIIGGVFYRSKINKCLQGKYLFSDLGGAMWVSQIFGKRKSFWRVSFKCAPTSPLGCPQSGTVRGDNTEWGDNWSWGRDRSYNVYYQTSEGLFRVTKQSICGLRC